MAVQLLKQSEFSEEFEVNSLAFSPDESRIVCGGFSEETLSVRQLPGLDLIFQLALEYAGSPNNSVVWSSRNQIAALANNASEVRLWDGVSGQLLRQYDCSALGNLTGLAFDPSGATLAVAGMNLKDSADLLLLNLDQDSERQFDSGLDAGLLAWVGPSLVVAGGARTADAPLALSVLAPGESELALFIVGQSSDRDAFVCASTAPDVVAVLAWDNDEMLTRFRLFNIKQGTELLNEAFSNFDCEGAAYSRASGRVVVLLDDDEDSALQMLDDSLGASASFAAPGSYLNGGLAVSTSGKFVAVASAQTVAVFAAATL